MCLFIFECNTHVHLYIYKINVTIDQYIQANIFNQNENTVMQVMYIVLLDTNTDTTIV